jgi:GT2 family glycosyltransferase
MQKTMASIIILSVNEKDFLVSCLDSLRKMNFPYKYEIIVVDNGSTDGTQALIKKSFPYVKLIENKKNLGFAEGNNIGARAAKGKYLVMLNNDTQVTRDWLLELFNVAESDPTIGICAPKQLMGDKKTILYDGGAINYTGLSYSVNMYKRNFKETQNRETAFASGAAFFIRKDIVDRIGLFDKDYFIYHEDVDVSWRVRLAGYKIMFVPKSLIFHFFKFKRRPQKMYLLERNRFMTVVKNYGRRSLALVLPMVMLFEIPIFFYSIIRGWGIFKLKSYLYIAQNLRNILRKRRQIQKLRVVDDKEIVRLFSPGILFMQESGKLSEFASLFLSAYWSLIRKLF